MVVHGVRASFFHAEDADRTDEVAEDSCVHFGRLRSSDFFFFFERRESAFHATTLTLRSSNSNS